MRKNPKTLRRERAAEPQLVEGEKTLLTMRGPATSEIVVAAMKDLALLKKPATRGLTRKNEVRPFEDATSVEFLAGKNESGAFLYVSHNKKRPHNMVLGRLFDGHVLDMLELGLVSYTPLREHKGPKKSLGSQMAVVFAGEGWEADATLTRLRNMLLDVFTARDLTGLSLEGVDTLLFVAVDAARTVSLRTYYLDMKVGDVGGGPRIELHPMGPDLDWVLRRSHTPSPDLEKLAMKVPAQLKAKKARNVEHDDLGEKHGRVHMERQDFDKLALRKTKAIKADRKRKASEISGGAAERGDGGDDDDDDDDDEEDDGYAYEGAAAAADEAPRRDSGAAKKARKEPGADGAAAGAGTGLAAVAAAGGAGREDARIRAARR